MIQQTQQEPQKELSRVYNNPTESKFLREIQNIKIRDYALIRIKDNFFIWKANKGTHYIRLTLMREGWHDETFFYWNLERDFKPFNYKHNHREDANEKSETFKANETDKFYNYFLNMVDKLKGGY